jgi:hypothetical protein
MLDGFDGAWSVDGFGDGGGWMISMHLGCVVKCALRVPGWIRVSGGIISLAYL